MKKRPKSQRRPEFRVPKSGFYISLPRLRRGKGRKSKKSPYFPLYVLTPAQLQAVGRVSVETSNLESYLGIVIPLIAGVKYELADVIMSRVPVSRLLKMFQELAVTTLDDRKAQIGKQLVNRLKKAIEDRNRVVHGLWIGAPEDEAEYGKPYIPKNAFKYGRDGSKSFSARDILAVAKTMMDLQYDLWEFADSAWPEEIVYVPERVEKAAARRRQTRNKVAKGPRIGST